MTVQLTGTGGWGTRVGKCIALWASVDDFRGPTNDAMASSIYNEFVATDTIVVDNFFAQRNSYRDVHQGWLGSVQRVAQDATVQQVYRDSLMPSPSLDAALNYLIQQLKDNGSNCTRPAVAATPAAAGGNVGNAQLVASVVDPADGGTCDYSFAETLTATCTKDATSGANEFAEQFSVVGDQAASTGDYNWPAGSGVNGQVLRVTNAEAGTLVRDGSFESWSTGEPTYWEIVTDAGSTTIAQGVAPYRSNSSYNLEITSDGTTQTRLRSAALSLAAQKSYALGLAAKISATAAGTVVVKLVDGDGNTVNDEAGTPNVLSIDTSSGLSTSYALKTAFFRTPRTMPTALHLDVHLTAAPTSGRVVSIDSLSFALAQTLYAGGPQVALIAGTTRNVRGDRWTLAVTNSGGSDCFQRGCDRLFGLRTKGLKIPSASGFAILHDGLSQPSAVLV